MRLAVPPPHLSFFCSTFFALSRRVQRRAKRCRAKNKISSENSAGPLPGRRFAVIVEIRLTHTHEPAMIARTLAFSLLLLTPLSGLAQLKVSMVPPDGDGAKY